MRVTVLAPGARRGTNRMHGRPYPIKGAGARQRHGGGESQVIQGKDRGHGRGHRQPRRPSCRLVAAGKLSVGTGTDRSRTGFDASVTPGSSTDCRSITRAARTQPPCDRASSREAPNECRRRQQRIDHGTCRRYEIRDAARCDPATRRNHGRRHGGIRRFTSGTTSQRCRKHARQPHRWRLRRTPAQRAARTGDSRRTRLGSAQGTGHANDRPHEPGHRCCAA